HQVVEHQHLPVAMRTRADADRGDADALGDELGERGRNELEHHAPAACPLERHRSVEDALGGRLVLSLKLVASERGSGLRRETDVAEHRHAGAHQSLHDGNDLFAAFELHRIGERLLHQARGALERLRRRAVGEKRQVRDDEGLGRAAARRARVVHHVGERHRKGRVVAEHHHAERVTHQDEIDARFGDEARGRKVVRGEHGEAAALLAPQIEYRGLHVAPREAKSNSFRSRRCEGRTSVIARRIDSMRPGWFLSQSRSISPMRFRSRFSCEPHSVQGMIGKRRASAYAARSASATYTSGRITTCLPSSEASFAGIAFSCPPWKRLRKKVASTSSRWCPSAILVAPSSPATRYSTPRRSREHSEHIVLPSGITRFTTEYVSCSTMRKGTPRAPRYSGSTCAGNPGCFWSRFTATSSKRTGAFSRSESSTSSKPCESLPPERHTITRSPSAIIAKSLIASPAWRRMRLASFASS